MMLWLNNNGPLLSLFFSFVVTASTVVYAFLTWKLVSETIRMREVQTEPLLEATVEPLEKAINLTILKIKNIGLGSAFNVSLHFQAPDGSVSTSPIVNDFKRTNWISTGVSYLGPGQERRSWYTVMFENPDEKFSQSFDVLLTYQNSKGKVIYSTFPIDMSQIKGLYNVGEPPLESIAKSLKEIQADVERITSGRAAVEVISKTADEAALEQTAHRMAIDRMIKKSEGQS